MPRQRRVVFPIKQTRTKTMTSSTQQSPSARLTELLDNSARIEELSSASENEIADEQADWELADQEEVGEAEAEGQDSSDSDSGMHVHGWMASKLPNSSVPPLFAHPAMLQDTLVTESSDKHDK